MANLIRRISQNKIAYIVLLFLLIYVPQALYLPAESDRRLVVSCIGLDKNESQIEVSLLMVIPKSSGNVGNNYQLVVDNGEDLSEALIKIGLKTGREISFAHCELVIASNSILEDNLAEYLDYFIRTNNLTSNADILSCEKASELLSANINMAKVYSTTLKNIVEYNKSQTGAENINVNSFFKNYTSKNNCFYVPFLHLEESPGSSSSGSSASGSSSSGSAQSSSTPSSESSSSSGGSSSGGESSNNQVSSSSSSESSSSSQNKIIKYDGSFNVLKKGKKILYIPKDKILGLDIVDPFVESLIFEVKDISETNITDAVVAIEVLKKTVDSKIQFINGTPFVSYEIFLFIKIDEIFEKPYNSNSLNTVDVLLKDNAKKQIVKTINNSIGEAIEMSKEYEIDLFNVVKSAYSICHNDYLKFLETNKPEDIINKTKYVVNYKFAIRN